MPVTSANEDVPSRVTLAAGQWHGGYRLISWRADGGMGEVWKAERDGVLFAVKFIRDDPGRAPEKIAEYVKRMELEWRALERINHPNVVRSVELNLESRPPFLVLEWLEGRPLSDSYSSGGRPAPERTIAHVIDALRGLECVHEEGIVHRDVKPSNLFLVDGRVKLIDFGIAAGEDATRLTRTDVVAGSLPYFAPERIHRPGERAMFPCDVYAMGITLYELLTGELPFTSRNPADLMMMHLSTTMPDLRGRLPDAPEDLARIVECATRKNPDDRYANAGQFLEALERFAAANRIHFPPEPVAAPRVDGREITTEASYAEALAQQPGLCDALVADRRGQRRLHGWLGAVGGQSHSLAFKSLTEALRESDEEPWRRRERLVRFFDPSRPIRVEQREIKVTGNLAYVEREVLTALDDALPVLAPEEVERIGWALAVSIEARLPARAALYRRLGPADVIELSWQRDPQRGLRTLERSALTTVQDVALQFLRAPESGEDPFLKLERAAFVAHELPGRSIESLPALAYVAFEARSQKRIRFVGLSRREDVFIVRFALDQSLARFLRNSGLQPGLLEPLPGEVETVSLSLDETPEQCRALPQEVVGFLEGKLWERLGQPQDPPAGWWSLQQALSHAVRETMLVPRARKVVKHIKTLEPGPARARRVSIVVGAAFLTLAALVGVFGLNGRWPGATSASESPGAAADKTARKSVATGDLPVGESGMRSATALPRSHGMDAHPAPPPRARATTRTAVPATSAINPRALPDAPEPGAADTAEPAAEAPAVSSELTLDGIRPVPAVAAQGMNTRFEDRGDAVRDLVSGLSWQKRASLTPLTWAAAKVYCASKGWRVPTQNELLSIVDKAYDPTIDPAFPETPRRPFWSSPVGDGETGATVDFFVGPAAYPSGTAHVRCVR